MKVRLYVSPVQDGSDILKKAVSTEIREREVSLGFQPDFCNELRDLSEKGVEVEIEYNGVRVPIPTKEFNRNFSQILSSLSALGEILIEDNEISEIHNNLEKYMKSMYESTGFTADNFLAELMMDFYYMYHW